MAKQVPDPEYILAIPEILNELKNIRMIMEQFQKFVLEVTPDAAIEAIEELEEQLESSQ